MSRRDSRRHSGRSAQEEALLPGVSDRDVLAGGLVVQFRATGLPKMDTLGKCDGYLIVYAASKNSNEVKSKIVFQTDPVMKDLNPTWPPFQLNVPELCPDGDPDVPFLIEAFDWDKGTKDDYIGECMVTLRQLLQDAATFTLLEKQSTKKKLRDTARGQLTLVRVEPKLKASKELQQTSSKTGSNTHAGPSHRGSTHAHAQNQHTLVTAAGVVDREQLRTGSLELELRGKSLDGLDTSSNTSDCYFVIEAMHAGRWEKMYTSEIIDKTVNPVWKPFTISMKQLNTNDLQQPFRVVVYDQNSIAKDEEIGRCQATVLQMLDTTPEFQLINQKKKAKKGDKYEHSGLLQVISATPVHEEKTSSSASHANRPHSGRSSTSSVPGHDLPKVDSSGDLILEAQDVKLHPGNVLKLQLESNMDKKRSTRVVLLSSTTSGYEEVCDTGELIAGMRTIYPTMEVDVERLCNYNIKHPILLRLYDKKKVYAEHETDVSKLLVQHQKGAHLPMYDPKKGLVLTRLQMLHCAIEVGEQQAVVAAKQNVDVAEVAPQVNTQVISESKAVPLPENPGDIVELSFCGIRLEKMGMMGENSSHLRLLAFEARDRYVEVVRTNTIKSDNNPEWEPIKCTFDELCQCNPEMTIKLECWHNDKTLVGQCFTTLEDLLLLDGVQMELIRPERASEAKYTNSGLVQCINARVQRSHSVDHGRAHALEHGDARRGSSSSVRSSGSRRGSPGRPHRSSHAARAMSSSGRELSAGELLAQQYRGLSHEASHVAMSGQTALVDSDGHVLGSLVIQLRGEALDKRDLMSSDPYLIISDADGTELHRTEVVKANLNPVFATFALDLHKACGGDMEKALLVRCFDWDRNTADDEIGRCEVTLSQLLSTNARFPLINADLKAKDKKGKYVNSGTLGVVRAFVHTPVLVQEEYIRRELHDKGKHHHLKETERRELEDLLRVRDRVRFGEIEVEFAVRDLPSSVNSCVEVWAMLMGQLERMSSTEVVTDTADPVCAPLRLNVPELCGGDLEQALTLRVVNCKNDKVIGQCEVSVEDLLGARPVYPLYEPKSKKDKTCGTLHVLTCSPTKTTVTAEVDEKRLKALEHSQVSRKDVNLEESNVVQLQLGASGLSKDNTLFKVMTRGGAVGDNSLKTVLTSGVIKGTKEPMWRPVVVPVAELCNMDIKQVLEIHVFGHSIFGDSYLGQVSTDLATLLVPDQTYDLLDAKSSKTPVTGLLRVINCVVLNNADEVADTTNREGSSIDLMQYRMRKKKEQRAKRKRLRPRPGDTVRLQLKVFGVENKHMLGTADPFLVLLDASGKEVFRTEAIKNNLNPEWKPIEISCQELCNYDINALVEIRCCDKDLGKSMAKNTVGVVRVTLKRLLRSQFGTLEMSDPKDGSKKTGTLEIMECELVDGSGAEGESSSSSSSSSGAAFGKMGQRLRIKASAINLEAMDKGEQGGEESDAYLVFSTAVGDKYFELVSTEAVPNEASPSWEPLEVSVAELCEGDPRKPVLIQVWDFDANDEDDLIGEVETTMEQLLTCPVLQFRDRKHEGMVRIDECTLLEAEAEQQNYSDLQLVEGDVVDLHLRAVDLDEADTDWKGSKAPPDAYAIVSHLSSDGKLVEVKRTEAVSNSTRPNWKPFSVGALQLAPRGVNYKTVVIQLKDKNVMKDRLIGEVRTSLARLLAGEEHKVVDPAREDERGYTDSGRLQVVKCQVKKGAGGAGGGAGEVVGTRMTKGEQIKMHLGVNRLDKEYVWKVAELYVKVLRRDTSGAWERVYQSEVVESNEPVWNEFSVSEQELCRGQHDEQVRVQCFSHSSWQKDRLVGQVTLTVGQLMDACKKNRQLALKDPERSRERGYTASAYLEVLECVETDSRVQRTEPRPGDVAQMHLCAFDLPAKDLLSKSDPYVVVRRFVKKRKEYVEVHETEVVQDSANPEWKPFSVPVSTLCGGNTSELVLFQCFDWDSEHASDLIGQAVVSLGELLTTVDTVELIHPELEHSKGYRNSGVLKFMHCSLQPGISLDFVRPSGVLEHDVVRLGLRCKELRKMSMVGKDDPFLTISGFQVSSDTAGPGIELHRTEVVDNSLEPNFQPFRVSTSLLCRQFREDYGVVRDQDQPLLIQVWSQGGMMSKDKLIGRTLTSLAGLFEQRMQELVYDSGEGAEKIAGVLEVYSLDIVTDETFSDDEEKQRLQLEADAAAGKVKKVSGSSSSSSSGRGSGGGGSRGRGGKGRVSHGNQYGKRRGQKSLGVGRRVADSGMKVVRWQMVGENLVAPDDETTTLDPYFSVYRKRSDGNFVQVYRSGVQLSSESPQWPEFTIGLEELCQGDDQRPILIECKNLDQYGGHKLIGRFTTTLKELESKQGRLFILRRPATRRMRQRNNTGTLEVLRLSVEYAGASDFGGSGLDESLTEENLRGRGGGRMMVHSQSGRGGSSMMGSRRSSMAESQDLKVRLNSMQDSEFVDVSALHETIVELKRSIHVLQSEKLAVATQLHRLMKENARKDRLIEDLQRGNAFTYDTKTQIDQIYGKKKRRAGADGGSSLRSSSQVVNEGGVMQAFGRLDDSEAWGETSGSQSARGRPQSRTHGEEEVEYRRPHTHRGGGRRRQVDLLEEAPTEESPRSPVRPHAPASSHTSSMRNSGSTRRRAVDGW